MRVEEVDDNGDRIDTLSIEVSLDKKGIMVDGIKYPIDIFTMVYNVKPIVANNSFNLWTYKYDAIAEREVIYRTIEHSVYDGIDSLDLSSTMLFDKGYDKIIASRIRVVTIKRHKR